MKDKKRIIHVFRILVFFNSLGRYISPEEIVQIWDLEPQTSLLEVKEIFDFLVWNKTAKEKGGFYTTYSGKVPANRRSQDFILEKKRHILVKRSRFFNYIPFVEFVLMSGSVALGNVSERSDLDVIVGAKSGRIFTVRFFCLVLFRFLGMGRRKEDDKEGSNNKLCFSHFMTPASYRFYLPDELKGHEPYWRLFFLNLKPVSGKPEKLDDFLKVNELPKRQLDFSDYDKEPGNLISRFLEFILAGRLGNFLERSMEFIQIRKIEKSSREKKTGRKPIVRYNKEELVFYPDIHDSSLRTDDFIKRYNEGLRTIQDT